MLDPSHRTFICSVVYIDLAGYARQTVAEQARAKALLTERLSGAIRDVPVNDRIILDTGDGAAVSFLGDPEDALFTALALREAMGGDLGAEAGAGDGDVSFRIGVNLGPVKLAKDAAGLPNVIGDGIHVAQRIAGFARPGQIVVTRAYYDAVSRLAGDYARLFTYEGSRTDRHVREHEIYVVGADDEAMRHARAGARDRTASTLTNVKRPDAAMLAAAGDGERASMTRDRQVLTTVAVALAAVVAALGFLAATRKADGPAAPAVAEAPAVARPEAASPSTIGQPEPIQPEAAKAQVSPAAADAPAGDPAGAVLSDGSAPARVAMKPEPAQVRVATKPEPAKAPPTPAAPAVPPATIALDIRPWGEVFVNGRSQGASPPVKSLKLAPGQYRIEVRNTSFPPHTEVIDVKARDERVIRHRFP